MKKNRPPRLRDYRVEKKKNKRKRKRKITENVLLVQRYLYHPVIVAYIHLVLTILTVTS